MRAPARRLLTRRAAAGLTALAVSLAVIDDGGYSPGTRVRFGALALLAAALAVAGEPRRARRLLREPALVALLALAVLGAASAAWTTGIEGDALRWGLVTAGYAAVAVAAALLAGNAQAVRLAAAGVALLAVGIGIVGLAAAAETTVPLAYREAGRWRPGATFEYPPALALLMVCALPALLTGMLARRRALAAVAGLGGAVAASVLVLTDSRTQLAFAVVLAAVALGWPQRLLGQRRGPVGAALALLLAAGAGAYAAAGGYIVLTPPPDGTARLLELLGVLAATGAAWPLVRAALARRVPAAALAAVLVAVAAGAVLAKPPPRLISAGVAPHRRHAAPRARPASHRVRDQLLHGRLRIWREALESFADRPLRGGGADSYLFASARHQDGHSVLYAHDLPLELAAELGIGGLLLGLVLYAGTARVLWRGRAGPAAWLLGPAAAAFALANLVDWPWHLAGTGAVWAVALGAMMAPAQLPDAARVPASMPSPKEIA